MRNNEAYFHKYPITLITKNNQEIEVRNLALHRVVKGDKTLFIAA